MKKIIIAFIVLLVVRETSAQETIIIRVLDSLTNEPIGGASVIGKEGYSGLTDRDGALTLLLKGNPIVALTISSVGYKSKLVNASKAQTNTIMLIREIQLMEPIEIKSVRAEDIYPFTQTLITKKEIDQKNIGQDLPFLLNQIPVHRAVCFFPAVPLWLYST